MGGKDAIIVDEDADLDAAADGIVAVGLRLPGPEVLGLLARDRRRRVYDELRREASSRAAQTLDVGDPATTRRLHGPGDQRHGATKTILDYIEIGKQEGRVLVGGGRRRIRRRLLRRSPPSSPTSRPTRPHRAGGDLRPGARASSRRKDFDDALAIANDTEYGLTGAVYSATASSSSARTREFLVGNLYLNRKCTGAHGGRAPLRRIQHVRHRLQGRRPRLSLPFTQAKSVAEKLTSKGLRGLDILKRRTRWE